MSLKVTNTVSEIMAGEIFPTITIIIQQLNEQPDTQYHHPVNLNIIDSKTGKTINNLKATTNKGISIFSSIMITKIGVYNLVFSTQDMLLSKKIKVSSSKKLFIRSTFIENTLIKSVPSSSNIKLQLEDIYGNKVDNQNQVSMTIKTDNENIELFGDIITYQVSIKNVEGLNFFGIDNAIKPELSFEMGKTYIFDLRDTLRHGFFFKLSTTIDGNHNDGSIFDLGCNYYQGKLYIMVMKNTPKRLFYFCQNHMNMGSQINISHQSSSQEYQLTGSKPLYLSDLIIPVQGKVFIYLISSSSEIKSGSLIVNIINRSLADPDDYIYNDYQFDYLLQSSVYTEKFALVNNEKFRPRTNNLVPWESGLSESVFLNYKKNRPQELESIPVNVDNSKGGVVQNGPVFNPRIQTSYPSSSDNERVSIINNSTVGLTSGTLINMIKENTIQTGPKSYVVNDVLSLKDILKQKKVNNQPTSDPLKSTVVRVD